MITEWAKHNTNFRRVVYTTKRKQWVLMSIAREIGEEVHKHVKQTFYIVSGSGKITGDHGTLRLLPGMELLVRPGTKHNIVNTGKKPLKLYTTYEPPNHIDGVIHKTKRAADRDKKDEAFGEKV